MTDQLLFFDSEVDLLPTAAPSRVMVETRVAEVVSHAVVHQEPKTAFMARETAHWSWEDLRDYVAKEITDRFGVFPRDGKKEFGIFKNFVDRWGIERSIAIAQYAFETMDGRWKGSPVRFQRFCKNSDPYFAQPISDYLARHVL